MARGRQTALRISLTAEERQTLQAWQRATAMPAGQVRRGRIILLLDEGMPLSHIAQTVGSSRRFVYTWAERFMQQRLAGLADKGRRGRGQQPRPPERI